MKEKKKVYKILKPRKKCKTGFTRNPIGELNRIVYQASPRWGFLHFGLTRYISSNARGPLVQTFMAKPSIQLNRRFYIYQCE